MESYRSNLRRIPEQQGRSNPEVATILPSTSKERLDERPLCSWI
jgi:hypothetical protein